MYSLGDAPSQGEVEVTGQHLVSRRRVLQAALWAAPAVVLVAGSPAFAASIEALSPFYYSWGGNDANSSTPGTAQTQTTLQIGYAGSVHPPPSGDATFTFRVWFENSQGTEFGHTDYMVVITQGYSGRSEHNSDQFSGLRGGTYTVHWEMQEARDASGSRIAVAGWDTSTRSVTLNVVPPG